MRVRSGGRVGRTGGMGPPRWHDGPMERADLARMIDHTLLDVAATPGQVAMFCAEAVDLGVAALDRSGLADELVTGSIDDHLNDVSYIVPGLGDAGDRQFGLW